MHLRLLPRNLLSLLRSWLRRRFRGRRAPAGIGPYVNRIISDAVLFNEIPSPTEREAQRAAFIAERLGEFGIGDVQMGPDGSVSCALPSADPAAGYLLLLANTDNESYSPLESLVRLSEREASGLGIADNSLGVAALLVLAEYLHKEQASLSSNLVFLFAPLASETALESFVRERKETFRAALFLSGLRLGDVETRPLGCCELVVTVRTRERPVYPDGRSSSAVAVLAGIASRLGNVRWSDDDETVLNIARLRAGVGFGYFPSEGTMEVEIYSPNASLLQMARDAAMATIRRTADEMGSTLEIQVRSALPAASQDKSRFLVEALQAVHRQLGIRSREVAAASRSAHLGLPDVPVATVGIATGRKSLTEEAVDLASVEKGFRQLLLLLERLAPAAGGNTP